MSRSSSSKEIWSFAPIQLGCWEKFSHTIFALDQLFIKLTTKTFDVNDQQLLCSAAPSQANTSQSYIYQVLQTIQMKLILLCVWPKLAISGSTKTAIKFKYEI